MRRQKWAHWHFWCKQLSVRPGHAFGSLRLSPYDFDMAFHRLHLGSVGWGLCQELTTCITGVFGKNIDQKHHSKKVKMSIVISLSRHICSHSRNKTASSNWNLESRKKWLKGRTGANMHLPRQFHALGPRLLWHPDPALAPGVPIQPNLGRSPLECPRGWHVSQAASQSMYAMVRILHFW